MEPPKHQQPQNKQQPSRYASLVPEILWTEGRYVQGLQRFSALHHLVLDQATLPADVAGQVFGNIDALLHLHKQLLDQMRSISMLPYQDQDWSTAFSTLAHASDIYVTYIANHKTQLNAAIREQQRILTTRAPPEVLQLVSDRYMMYHTFQWPYSRFARYSCILKDLLHEIRADQAKHAALQAASVAYHLVLHRANEALTHRSLDQDAGDLFEHVEDWKGLDPSSFGKLVLFQTLACRPGARPESEAPFQVYLFETILLCCKKSKHPAENHEAATLRLKGRIFLSNILDIAISPEPPHRLNLLWRAANRVEPTTLLFSSSSVMGLWVDKIQRLRTCQVDHTNQVGGRKHSDTM